MPKPFHPPPGPKETGPFIIRDATFSDAPTMAAIAARGYWDSALSKILSPLRQEFPQDDALGYERRIKARMLSARNRSYVAVPAEGGEPVGYMMCQRLGDDEAAKVVEREKARLWTGIVEWGYGMYVKAAWWMWPNRSVSAEGLAWFLRIGKEEEELHWKVEERKCRWYVQSCVVAEEWRGRGVGKKLLEKVLDRAQREGVVVGLEASSLGEWLYRSVGFKLLGRFKTPVGSDEVESGGIMMWSPK